MNMLMGAAAGGFASAGICEIVGMTPAPGLLVGSLFLLILGVRL